MTTLLHIDHFKPSRVSAELAVYQVFLVNRDNIITALIPIGNHWSRRYQCLVSFELYN